MQRHSRTTGARATPSPPSTLPLHVSLLPPPPSFLTCFHGSGHTYTKVESHNESPGFNRHQRMAIHVSSSPPTGLW